MSEYHSIAEEIKNEKNKFHSMGFQQKKAYIWLYYKWHIIITIVLLITVMVTVIGYLHMRYENKAYIVVFDGRIDGGETGNDLLTKGFTDYLGIDGKHNKVTFDYNYRLNVVEGNPDAYYSLDKLITMVTADQVEGYICDKSELNKMNMLGSDYRTNLEEVFSAKEVEYLSQYFIYSKNENGELLPYAIDLTKAKMFKDRALSISNPCYGIIETSPKKESAVAFIRFAFGL